MDDDSFARLVSDAVDSLPEEFLERMENVELFIEDWPSRDDLEEVGLRSSDRRYLLGLYHGVPLTDRGIYYSSLPDRITIYQKPIELAAGNDPAAIKEQVRHTVIHEIAHYYGISDERLDELGSERIGVLANWLPQRVLVASVATVLGRHLRPADVRS